MSENEPQKHPGGRPLKFSSVEQMDALIEAYFAKCVDPEGKIIRPMSVTGLALALGITRSTLDDYEEKPEFSYSVKMAKLQVERFYEERLIYANATGPIFALKNFGWKDSQSHEMSGPNGNPIETRDTGLTEIARRIAFVFASADHKN